jgi:Zn-dependent protease
MEMNWKEVLMGFLILITAITLRQYAKAWLMDRLGDPIPRSEGRVTLDPMAHIDLWGTGIFPLLFLSLGGMPVYGWGRHLFVRNEFFKNPIRDEINVSLVGSVFNLVVALVCAILGGLLGQHWPQLMALFVLFIQQNVLLAVLSLLPIPPLDGSILFKHLLRMSEETYVQFTRYGMFIFLLIIIIPQLRVMISWPFEKICILLLNLMMSMAL